jgi:hypothetical protein
MEVSTWRRFLIQGAFSRLVRQQLARRDPGVASFQDAALTPMTLSPFPVRTRFFDTARRKIEIVATHHEAPGIIKCH